MAYDEGLAERVRDVLAHLEVAAVDQNDEALTAWVQRGLAFTGSLPAK